MPDRALRSLSAPVPYLYTADLQSDNMHFV